MTENLHLGENNLPLAGIRVLELGNFVAAPFAARIFGDFGAEVIKIERPNVGDELRDWRKSRGSTSMLFRTVGRNKKSVALDLRSELGAEAIKKIVASTDVIIENFRPGTLEKWGLGPEVLNEINPNLVIVRISGYGQTGPYKDRAGFGSSAESFAGLRYITGEPDRPAGRAAASLGDTVAGLYGVIGALMLMLNRARGGSNQSSNVVDVALYEGIFSLLESLVPDYDAYGMVRQRTGGRLPGVVPTGSYTCADGLEVVIGGNSNSVFVRLMKAIGREDLATDTSLLTTEGRGAREEELNGAIESFTGSMPLEQALEVLDAAGVPAAPVYDAPSIAKDEHYIARGMIETHEVVIDDEPELIRFPGVVPKIPGHEGSVRWVGPELGEHTDQVLRELAGFDAGQLAALNAEAVSK
ncbi:formyl-CoA transferase [Arthrobacter sp. MYb211]|uniref:CaiB/BaiF CoA transferase family protein n=1 Tax=unclassified Arthrobacter TaxID=235627 RepID=UPI000CFB8A47|nr:MULTISPECIES: CaiB/BaiF CoA-transferase family protein [unclassified Arthrobacter]PRA08261.1 formyl-CoA transferase [Arthrobacter sp. MYb221]PRC02875.1 formyl-CoA transferase [Arthrobacter sp. MYb211]